MEMKFGKTTEIERQVSASSEAFTVKANVRVANDRITGITSGEVTNINGQQEASFSYYGTVSVNFNATDPDVMASTLEAINDFVEACKHAEATIATEAVTDEGKEVAE